MQVSEASLQKGVEPIAQDAHSTGWLRHGYTNAWYFRGLSPLEVKAGQTALQKIIIIDR
jgi:hypothetical protein